MPAALSFAFPETISPAGQDPRHSASSGGDGAADFNQMVKAAASSAMGQKLGAADGDAASVAGGAAARLLTPQASVADLANGVADAALTSDKKLGLADVEVQASGQILPQTPDDAGIYGGEQDSQADQPQNLLVQASETMLSDDAAPKDEAVLRPAQIPPAPAIAEVDAKAVEAQSNAGAPDDQKLGAAAMALATPAAQAQAASQAQLEPRQQPQHQTKAIEMGAVADRLAGQGARMAEYSGLQAAAEARLDGDSPADGAQAEQSAANASSKSGGSTNGGHANSGSASALAGPTGAADLAAKPAGADGSLPAALLTQAMAPMSSSGAGKIYAGISMAALPEPVVQAEAGRFGTNMGAEIAKFAKGDGDNLLIRLDPRELGRVDVRLSFDREGVLRAVMSAESPAALEMLRRESGDLSRALADAGVRSDSQSLRFDTRSGEGFGQGGPQNGAQGDQGQQARFGGAQGGAGRDGQDGHGDANANAAEYQPLRTNKQVNLIA